MAFFSSVFVSISSILLNTLFLAFYNRWKKQPIYLLCGFNCLCNIYTLKYPFTFILSFLNLSSLVKAQLLQLLLSQSSIFIFERIHTSDPSVTIDSTKLWLFTFLSFCFPPNKWMQIAVFFLTQFVLFSLYNFLFLIQHIYIFGWLSLLLHPLWNLLLLHPKPYTLPCWGWFVDPICSTLLVIFKARLL